MLRRLIVLAALAFGGFFALLWWQGPDDTTQSEVIDLKAVRAFRPAHNEPIHPR